jgi:hypothetical protein
MTVFLPSAPLAGSALIIAVACGKGIGITAVRPQSTEEWNLLYENEGTVTADQNTSGSIRAQIWAAFDIPDGLTNQFGIVFSGGVNERGVILAEYTGDIFQFPNPADRVAKATGTTPAFTTGTLDTGSGGTTREANELWVGVGAATPTVAFSNPGSPFSIRVNAVAIGTGPGRMCLLDAFLTSLEPAIMRVDHDDLNPAIVTWVAAMAATRGILQVPAAATTVPTVSEPVTEQTDYSSDGIEKLIAQLRANA